MNSVQCTVYSVQCTLYNEQCTVNIAQCAVYTVECTYLDIQLESLRTADEDRRREKRRVCGRRGPDSDYWSRR